MNRPPSSRRSNSGQFAQPGALGLYHPRRPLPERNQNRRSRDTKNIWIAVLACLPAFIYTFYPNKKHEKSGYWTHAKRSKNDKIIFAVYLFAVLVLFAIFAIRRMVQNRPSNANRFGFGGQPRRPMLARRSTGHSSRGRPAGHPSRRLSRRPVGSRSSRPSNASGLGGNNRL